MLDAVSTAIHGGAAAMNVRLTGPALFAGSVCRRLLAKFIFSLIMYLKEQHSFHEDVSSFRCLCVDCDNVVCIRKRELTNISDNSMGFRFGRREYLAQFEPGVDDSPGSTG